MKIMVVALLIVAAAPFTTDVTNEEAIKICALDYMEGALSADAARMERAIHPELTKVTPQSLKETGKTALRKSGSSQLVELVRAKVALLDEDQWDTEVEIHDVLEGLASVRVTSSKFYDYLQLANIDGQWKIIHVLWKNNSAETGSGGEDVGAIENTARDYIEGSFSGDAARMERALHPELTKVIPYELPQTGKLMLSKMGAGMLIEGTRAKMGLLDEDKRNIEVTVLDTGHDLAAVKVTSAMYYDFLQMAKIDGQWKIVNVLWKMNPSAPKKEKS